MQEKRDICDEARITPESANSFYIPLTRRNSCVRAEDVEVFLSFFYSIWHYYNKRRGYTHMGGEPKTSNHSRDAALLQAAFHQEGCPVCRVVLENMHMAMDTWNYEGFTDVAHRQLLARVRGFCPVHTWQLAERNNTFQLAVVYKEILEDMLDTMRTPHASEGRYQQSGVDWLVGLRRLFQGEPAPSTQDTDHLYDACPFCRTRTELEERVVGRLGELVRDETMLDLLCHSTGLCRVHFLHVLHDADAHTPSPQQALFECQRSCLQRSFEEIQEQIRKHDYRFSQEPHGEEMTAWRRAAELCAGSPGVW